MATPLSPLSATSLNQKSPSKAAHRSQPHKPTTSSLFDLENDDHSLTAISSHSTQNSTSPFGSETAGPGELRCAKVRSPNKSPSKTSPAKSPRKRLPEVPMRENEGLTNAIKIMEDEADGLNDHVDGDDSLLAAEDRSGYGDMDDTAFSAFSAVPNADMTLLARAGQELRTPEASPTKGVTDEFSGDEMLRVQPREPVTPGTMRQDVRQNSSNTTPVSPSPTPRHKYSLDRDATSTNLILDFTEQFNALSASASSYLPQSPTKSSLVSTSKSQTQPDLAAYTAGLRNPSPNRRGAPPPSTPSGRKNWATLLDFDIPPPPTPRSIPSISARELESLKSGYLSQISSLKASLSGKDAQVKSLMDAVGDAERRVGEAQETLREERGMREALQADRESWEQRGSDMEALLRSVKEDILCSERERDDLAKKLAEAEQRHEEAETRAVNAESKIAGLEAAAATAAAANPAPSSSAGSGAEPAQTSTNTSAKDVEAAVEKVARELHALYKSKHEAKVSALKKSYEARWDKRVHDLERQLAETQHELEHARTATGAPPPPATSTGSGTCSDAARPGDDNNGDTTRADEDARRLEEQDGRISALAQELGGLRRENGRLARELEKERVEKGELVRAVEEMLSMSAGGGGGANVVEATAAAASSATATATTSRTVSSSSITKVHRVPSSGGGGGDSRIGRMNLAQGGGGGAHARSRSGIMSNIERMGRGRSG